MVRKPGKEEWKTYGNVFDESTLRAIFKLESQGYFEKLLSPIKVGKESNVFSAIARDGLKVCVKIYRVNACDFKKMHSYIRGDSRFPRVSGKRQIIYLWAKREYRNLFRCYQRGVRVPRPIAVYQNVLVMEFIEGRIAAKSRISRDFADGVVSQLVKIHKAGLIHGDFSEFNIIDAGVPVVIDLSHGVCLDYPNAGELLERDAANTARFLSKNGFNCKSADIMARIK